VAGKAAVNSGRWRREIFASIALIAASSMPPCRDRVGRDRASHQKGGEREAERVLGRFGVLRRRGAEGDAGREGFDLDRGNIVRRQRLIADQRRRRFDGRLGPAADRPGLQILL
jgi:hypothetical protein